MYKSKFSLFVLINVAIVLFTGCGGGGGGSSAVPATGSNTDNSTGAIKISENEIVQDFIAREVAGVVNRFDEAQTRASKRSSTSIRAYTEQVTGTGQATLNYGPNDRVERFGESYTYTSGQIKLVLKDYFGDYTEDITWLDSISFGYRNLKCLINTADHQMTANYNGDLIFSGFYKGNPVVMTLNQFSINAKIDNTYDFYWTMNGNVSVDTSYNDYPLDGSYLDGSIIINNNQYDYTTLYDGTNEAKISFYGAEELQCKVNLDTGKVSNLLQYSHESLIGTWQLIQEEREGVMLPVFTNNSGKVSEITFNADNTFSYESYDRRSDDTIDYWQTKDVAPVLQTGTYSLEDNKIILTANGETVTHTLVLKADTFQQINQYNESYIWKKT
jgi:hypothetical protein